MKMTMEIPDALLEEAKAVAVREGTTLRALVEQGLREILEGRESAREFKVRDASVSGNGLQPAAKGMSWDELRELAHGRETT